MRCTRSILAVAIVAGLALPIACASGDSAGPSETASSETTTTSVGSSGSTSTGASAGGASAASGSTSSGSSSAASASSGSGAGGSGTGGAGGGVFTGSGPDNAYCDPGDIAKFGAKDGPAALPQACVYTALSGTPSPGKTIAVPAGGDVAAALASASCGDTVTLAAGASYPPFTVPAKSCDAGHWITIRTSAADSALPPEGTRITPCYAGVASLPGRPAYGCSSPANVMAQVLANQTSGITFAPGANHYRLIGIEVTRKAGTGIVYRLATLSAGTDHVIFDRCWFHGVPLDETNHGIGFGDSTYIAAIDSYFNDFHCTAATGTCTDAQAIAGGVGTAKEGPYKIVDNFLEAAGENILFGGGPATTTPADIEVRRNHHFKPLTWLKTNPGFIGTEFIVKNLFELKNAQRLLLEGDVLEYTWGGYSQNGSAILLTPKSQNSQCPTCEVLDITIRYNTISHVGTGIQIANGASDSGGLAKDGGRYSIHDITIDDVEAATYVGGGGLFQISTTLFPNSVVLHDLSIAHITAFGDPSSHLATVGDNTTNPKMPNFIFTNNVVTAGKYPIWSTGGGSGNCAYADVPITTVSACFSPVSFVDNAIIASPSAYPPSKWPSGNQFPADTTAVGFVNYNGGNGGDYHLAASSPYKGAASDGKDLGADIDAIQKAITGVAP